MLNSHGKISDTKISVKRVLLNSSGVNLMRNDVVQIISFFKKDSSVEE